MNHFRALSNPRRVQWIVSTDNQPAPDNNSAPSNVKSAWKLVREILKTNLITNVFAGATLVCTSAVGLLDSTDLKNIPPIALAATAICGSLHIVGAFSNYCTVRHHLKSLDR